MRLNFKTRGNADPQGRPRVYYTAHPGEHKRYLQPVAEDIFKYQNCAVYYDEEFEKDVSESDLQLLEEMHLFVIPVTTRFLCEKNRALERELPFAVSRHIPVLPLLQERGLEELFNEKCGDIQILGRDDVVDPVKALAGNVSGYEEKLERFLQSVLVGEELTEQIRKAFDAYVFLSYRKQDRAYAQELMRLIHQNDFCRDIAIWYDEFLLPGENFCSAIKAALEKSRLFAMAVTPNLLEQDNYVMTTEYPRAQEMGKPVLPLELEKTDWEELKQKFPGIPASTDARDPRALSDALLAHLREIAVREEDASPEHLFFIGLAYLKGIDVETDRRRAFALITRAADAGLLDALKKLVSMYLSGEGVECDFSTAAQWQARVTEWWEEAFAAQADEEFFEHLLSALRDLGEQYYDLEELKKAEAAFLRMKELCDAHPEMTDKEWQSCILSCLGDVCEAEGRLAEAEAFYQECLLLAEELNREEALAAAFKKLGDLAMKRGGFREARTLYEKALQIRRKLAREEGTEEARRRLSIIDVCLGKLCMEEALLSEAEEYFQASLAVRRQLLEENVSSLNKKNLGSNLHMLGNVCHEAGRAEEARKYYLEGLELYRQAERESGQIDDQYALSCALDSVGTFYREEGLLKDAYPYQKEDLELSRRLCAQTGSVRARRGLALSCEKFADLLWEMGRREEAWPYYREAHEQFCRLYEETGTVDALSTLAANCSHMADSYMDEKQYEKALEYYQKAQKLAGRLCERTENVKALRSLAVSYNNLGCVYKELRQYEQAEAHYEEGLKLAGLVAGLVGFLEDKINLVTDYDNMACYKNEMEEYEEAIRYEQKALEAGEPFGREEKYFWKIRRKLYEIRVRTGKLCMKSGRLAEAEDYFRSAVAALRSLQEETGSVRDRRGFAAACGQFGDLLCRMSRREEGRPYFQTACEQFRRLYEETGTEDDLYWWATCFGFIVGSYIGEERYEEVLEYSRRELADRLYEHTEDAQIIDGIADICHYLGVALSRLGRQTEAAAYFTESRELIRRAAGIRRTAEEQSAE